MTNLKNWAKLGAVLCLSIGLSVLLFNSPYFDAEQIQALAPDFHYNAISTSAIIGGFLFTGIGILISAIERERIKRLWDNYYLDNLYRSAFIGMISNVITIVTSFLLLFLDVSDDVMLVLVYLELATLITGIVFFVCCIRYLFFIISKLKG